MQTSRQAIQAAIETGEIPPEGIQPSILYNRNLDHAQAVSYMSGYVNEAWQPKLKKWLEEGYIVFRIQTEFDMMIGHNTMAYLVKLKAN